MLRLFHSFFGGAPQETGYPESLVKAAIERAVDGTDPWLRGLSGYKKKLRPAVLRAIDHVVALVDRLPPSIVVDSGSYGDDPRLRAFFISLDDLRTIIDNDRNLAEFRRGPGGYVSPVIALLTMEKQERVFFGAALSGDIVLRDVPQTSVSFAAHRLLDPTGSEEETRRQLKRRAFDHLLSLALQRITAVKAERDTLERRRALLQAKHALLQREGWGFDAAGSPEGADSAGVEEQLGQIERQLQEVGGDDRMLELYLGIVTDVLGRPEEHLWDRQETVIVDRMGIKRSEAAPDAPELTLNVLHNAEGRSLVMTLVALADEVR